MLWAVLRVIRVPLMVQIVLTVLGVRLSSFENRVYPYRNPVAVLQASQSHWSE